MARVQEFALRIALASVLLATASTPVVAAELPDDGQVLWLDLGRPHWDITGATVWDDEAGAGRWRPMARRALQAASEPPAAVVRVAADASFQTVGFTSTGPTQTGKAAWYGAEFDGRLTASGERFDMYRLTAASDQAPLNSYVSVSNRATGETVVVRINDRRPAPAGELITLSAAAAMRLGLDATPGALVDLRPVGAASPKMDAPIEVAAR